MGRPNFYCGIEALNALLEMEPEDEGQDVELSLDLIELPYYFLFTGDERTRTVRAFSRGEIYQHTDDGIEAGRLTVDRESGQGQGTAKAELKDSMGAFFDVCRRLSAYFRENHLAELWEDRDAEEAGILLTEEDGALTHRIVEGKERPEMMCTTLFGGTVMTRPYMEDFMESSAREAMSLEEKTEAAENGDTGCMNDLALGYLNGDDGMEADPAKAVYWFRRLAESGDSNGMFNLGLHCAKGFGTERDFPQAAHWMEEAARHGDEDAPRLVERYHRAAEAMEKVPSGDAQAQADLARILMELGGSLDQAGPGRDYAEAFDLARRSAEQGNGDGLWTLALAYEHGRGVRQDDAKAIDCYRKGAELGHAACQHSLACRYMRGDGLEEDQERAFRLIRESAEQGYALAVKDMGVCYQFGNGVEGDMGQAIAWYERYLESNEDPELARKVTLFKMLEKSIREEDEDGGEMDGEAAGEGEPEAGVYDDGLTFRLKPGYEIERDTDDDGDPRFRVCYGGSLGDDGERQWEFTCKVGAREGDTEVPEEKRNLEGNFHAAVRAARAEQQVLFLTVTVLVAAVVVEHKGRVYTLICHRAFRDDIVKDEVETLAERLNDVIAAMVIEGDAADMAPVTAELLLESTAE